MCMAEASANLRGGLSPDEGFWVFVPGLGVEEDGSLEGATLVKVPRRMAPWVILANHRSISGRGGAVMDSRLHPGGGRWSRRTDLGDPAMEKPGHWWSRKPPAADEGPRVTRPRREERRRRIERLPNKAFSISGAVRRACPDGFFSSLPRADRRTAFSKPRQSGARSQSKDPC
jgi:hypothetical protein